MSADATSYAMAQKIGWVLLHTLWQGLLIGLGFAALRRILRQHSANARYAVSCFALTLMVAAPIVTLLGKPSGIESTRSAISAEDVSHSEVAGNFENESRTLSAIRSGAERLGRMTPFIAAAWLMGVAVFSGRLARSCFEVRTLRLKSHEAVEPGWIERLADLRCRLEITRPVLLLKSTLVQVPTVIGWFRPVILLPIATITGLSPEQLDAILAHELAHVRRHDYLVNAVQCAVETLFFYHPIVWWISRCIREERELCCDDLVIKVCGDRIIYARALATLEESRAGLLEIAFAANGGSLLNRIRRLLGAPQEGPVTAAQTAGFALLALGVACLAAGAYVLLAAPKYEAAARIQFEWRAPVGVQLQGRNMKASGPDPMSFQTEAELIQSEAVLGKVIDEQNLQVLWGKRYGEGNPSTALR
jgi:beta-lactamase regulating signal transducer with metallopeptidase domain